jgi:hypothetical protein
VKRSHGARSPQHDEALMS